MAELPVVKVWPMIGPVLRIRRNRPVLTFWNVVESARIQCWLVKPLPPLPAVSTVTFAPGLVALLVMASPELVTRKLPSENWQNPHEVVRLVLGFSRTVDPEEALLGVPGK